MGFGVEWAFDKVWFILKMGVCTYVHMVSLVMLVICIPLPVSFFVVFLFIWVEGRKGALFPSWIVFASASLKSYDFNEMI